MSVSRTSSRTSSSSSAAPVESFNQRVIAEFRANGGRVGGPFAGGDLLLLTTTGARSGRPHTVPLGFVRDDDGQLLVVASAAGAPDHPDWYLNLLAHPLVRVELGTERFEAVAVPAEGARREELFAVVVAAAPGYGDYQAHTERLLPVVVLEPDLGDPDRPPVTSLADKLLEVHTWLRGQLHHVRQETEAHFAGSANGSEPRTPALGFRIRQHCLAFCEALTFHHTGEDAAVFPGLARSHPHLRGTLDELAEQHKAVAELRAGLTELLADLPTADPERFRAELARMSAELEAHLAYEEEALLPALAEIPFPPRR